VHAACFPESYPSYWRPIQEKHFGYRDQYVAPLADESFWSFQRASLTRAVRTEEEFFRFVLRMDMPAARLGSPPSAFRIE